MVALNLTARSPLHSYRQVAVDVSTLALAAEIDPSFFPAGATYLRRGLCRDDRQGEEMGSLSTAHEEPLSMPRYLFRRK